MGSPPGFEGTPRYKHITVIDKEKETHKTTMHPYASIQQTCAKKLNIFLPTAGYSHIVLEEDSTDKLYEMAYQNEFRRGLPTPESGLGGVSRYPSGNGRNQYSNYYVKFSAHSN